MFFLFLSTSSNVISIGKPKVVYKLNKYLPPKVNSDKLLSCFLYSLKILYISFNPFSKVILNLFSSFSISFKAKSLFFSTSL